MKIEHVAWQVEHPHAAADWYIKHLGFVMKRKFYAPVPCCFLADSSGVMMIEIYRNPAIEVPDYASQDPRVLHLAFVSEDPDNDSNRLIEAGARLIERIEADNGDRIVMLRDPWHFPIQLCKRGEPMI